MMDIKRINEDRIPSPLERAAVRGRMTEVYFDQYGKERVRKRSFASAWQLYMKEEQAALDVLLRKEHNLIASDVKNARQLYEIGDVLVCLQRMQDELGYTPMKAIRMYVSAAEELENESEQRMAA